GALSQEELDGIVMRTRGGGGEIVALLKTGSAYYAPAESATLMAKSFLKDKKRVLPVAAHLTGQYGQNNLYVGVPAVIGAGGVRRLVEFPLHAGETTLVTGARAAVKVLLDACRAIEPSLK